MPTFDPIWSGMAATTMGAFVASYSLGFFTRRWLLRLQIMDQPNQRSSHDTPTPRGGGVGIMVVVFFGGLWLASGTEAMMRHVIIAAALFLAAISFFDDRFSLSWRVRMGAQLLAAVVSVVAIWRVGAKPEWSVVLVGSPLLIFWIVAYANAFNFMDGINGIAGAQAFLTGIGTALLAVAAGLTSGHPAVLLSLLVAGAAAGFLPHNFPKARMFMGDVSSVPLGFLLAVLAVWIAHERDWWLVLLMLSLHANFALDTLITLVRRWYRGEVLYEAHREHFYQRLVRSGWSHKAVTGCESGLQLLVMAMAVLAARGGPVKKLVVLAVATSVWLAFFAICEREFRRKSRKENVIAAEWSHADQTGA